MKNGGKNKSVAFIILFSVYYVGSSLGSWLASFENRASTYRLIFG